jgi:preprotein translocase subunit SecG
MKRLLAFVLIFFLVFSLNLRLVNSLTSRECRSYVDGVCQSDQGYILEIQTGEAATTPITPSESYQPPNFIVLIFQMIGIVTLFIILVIIVQEMLKTTKKKSKIRKRK